MAITKTSDYSSRQVGQGQAHSKIRKNNFDVSDAGLERRSLSF
jgi:hypothetical protein